MNRISHNQTTRNTAMVIPKIGQYASNGLVRALKRWSCGAQRYVSPDTPILQNYDLGRDVGINSTHEFAIPHLYDRVRVERFRSCVYFCRVVS